MDDRVYALPLTLVSRLEEFIGEQVEYTGNQAVVRYLDKPMPLVELEKYLGLDGESDFKNKGEQKFSSVVVQYRGQNFALVVKEILDISIQRISLDTSTVDRKGILGTIFVNDKVVSLIDFVSILEMMPIHKNFKQEIQVEEGLKQKKILVVDDSVVYRRLESDTLVTHGFEVVLAENGEDGLDKLEQNPDIALVITDIEMPVMDGFSFISNVRKIEKFKDLPVLAVSTRVSKEDRQRGLDAGFNRHLEKFNSEKVIKEVIDLLN